ncbi:hypothetical protein EST38_g2244 [Candolleomyces aberdarensis]|uniref:Uncharacterized protein n=1 Tax=Candolleomyces aberdarensis TaxID=2316362 RepID=A0A4Q2DTN5_9AGAR|nr:hypothetical protein EST38_g2244 [Candolleomyces aberdarensis]
MSSYNQFTSTPTPTPFFPVLIPSLVTASPSPARRPETSNLTDLRQAEEYGNGIILTPSNVSAHALC